MTAPGTDGLPLFRQAVQDDWIDYNGHLSEAYYVLVFGFATDALMEAVGLGQGYREDTGCSLYTVEAHVRYLSEVPRGSHLCVRTTVLGADTRKVRLLHEMFLTGLSGGPEGSAVATEELFALHVDRDSGRSGPLPGAVQTGLGALVAPGPDWTGRGIREI
ncbi:thioesterase family protein [Streptomyces tsukubensis]|uniref:4-hydroxybenzoyl-CoA thioesterase n=1 Tax=Streptomyces tsukubensis TaxID=83656 RepID=A0A1V4AAP1_9ACTN|nr:thioesterase family protein [Streptomyces tsukubensis]OON80137.1 4-hydroxybenzoyl-CoA thioesterase [Streptomyces tsukubensis]QFR97366.1 thioesterase [Streptomyces tsukubensis]